MKLFQDSQEEPNDIQRIIFSLVEFQQEHEAIQEKSQMYRKNIKEKFDRKVKEDTFLMETWYLGGMQEKRKRVNMENLTTYGSVLL